MNGLVELRRLKHGPIVAVDYGFLRLFSVQESDTTEHYKANFR